MSTKLLKLSNKENLNNRQSSELCTNLIKIEKIESSQLTYNDFFWNYMHKNIPVVITSVSNDWPCRAQWVTTNSSSVNFEFLKNEIDNMLVPIANCSKEYFDSHQKSEMTFHEYLAYWEEQQSQITTTEDLLNKNILYLKDWHLKEKQPSYDFYEVPIYFASDWLNEFLIDNNQDDYRFVYMGPKGSWTPFHSDVYSSFSWSTNIFGIKKWLILPPKEELKLKDNLGNFPFSLDEEYLIKNEIKYLKVHQFENESIFVPSGWYHQVWNLTDTISVNHNWFNGCNITMIWYSLENCMRKVINEISDCRYMDNFENHCQVMLKALYGMNYEQFLDIIEHIAKKRIDSIKRDIDLISFKTYTYNHCHLLFDLIAINDVVKYSIENELIKNNKEFVSRCEHLLEILKDFCET